MEVEHNTKPQSCYLVAAAWAFSQDVQIFYYLSKSFEKQASTLLSRRGRRNISNILLSIKDIKKTNLKACILPWRGWGEGAVGGGRAGQEVGRRLTEIIEPMIDN